MRVVIFKVMGATCAVEWSGNAPASEARNQALTVTANIGQPPANFDMRDRAGNVIAPETLVRDLPKGDIFVSPRIGMGGSHTNYRRKLVPPIMNGHIWLGSTMRGRNNTRWNWGAHAKAQMTYRRLEERAARRAVRVDLHLQQREPP